MMLPKFYSKAPAVIIIRGPKAWNGACENIRIICLWFFSRAIGCRWFRLPLAYSLKVGWHYLFLVWFARWLRTKTITTWLCENRPGLIYIVIITMTTSFSIQTTVTVDLRRRAWPVDHWVNTAVDRMTVTTTTTTQKIAKERSHLSVLSSEPATVDIF